MNPIAGAAAVVTGAGSGIGRGIAGALARHGVSVIVTDIDAARADAVAKELADADAGSAVAVGLRCDVTAVADLEAAREACLEHFGRLDILVNNVGVLAVGYPLDIPIAEWERLVDTNLMSVVRGVHVFLPHLLAQRRGHIVNTASTSALFQYTYDQLPYSATKAAILAVTEGLAIYCRPRGVGVTCLCPGPVPTNIGESVRFYGDKPGVHLPLLSPMEADDLGELLVDGIERNRFFVVTSPEAPAALQRRLHDWDAFIDQQIANVQSQGG